MSSTKTSTNATDILDQILRTKCQKCKNQIISNEKDVTSLFQGWCNGKGTPNSLISCKRCSTTTCVGCGGRKTGEKPTTKVKSNGAELSWCCSYGRIFLLWVWLCGFDESYCAAKRHEAAQKGTGRRQAGSGTGYEANPLFGNGPFGAGFFDSGLFGSGPYGSVTSYDSYGFGVDGFEMQHYPGARQAYSQPGSISAGQKKAETAQQRSDQFTTTVLHGLNQLLPSDTAKEQTSFDRHPPEAIATFLLNSKILESVAEYLRNDSLDDIVNRKNVYLALLDLLQILGKHPALARKTMFSGRHTRDNSCGLVTISFPRRSSATKLRSETAAALVDVLHNLDMQCKAMLKVTQNKQREFQDEQGRNLLSMCRKISDLAESFKGKSTTGVKHVDERHGAGCGILEVDDHLIFERFNYTNIARYMQQSPRGRIKRLVTEIATLKTGLPQGIFVKYASSRPDCMKVVIVGPEDTPYENGLFEFDLFCPLNYPFEPPRMFFWGTDRGQAQINPNLHADGKVCLSLLGTWEGEPWRPGQSTLLQVLVSIQAMIFCDHPMANEPMFTEYTVRQDSHDYEKMVRLETVQVAMLPWLQHPPKLWKDVVALHFKKKGEKILAKVTTWETDNVKAPPILDSRLPTPGNIGELRRQLHLELQKIEAMSSSRQPAPVQPDPSAQPQRNCYYPGGAGYGGSGYGGSGYGGPGFGGSDHGYY